MNTIETLRALQLKTICLGSHPGIIQSVLDYDYLSGAESPSIIGIIATNRKQERYFWGESEISIRVSADFHSLTQEQKKSVNSLITFQSGRRVLSGITEAFTALPGLRVSTIFAEQVPEKHALKIAELSRARNIIMCGPASVGIIVPGAFKLGAIGGTQYRQIIDAGIAKSGDTAVISTSGGMVNELIHAVTRSGRAVSFAISLGGDRFPITSPAEAFILAEQDAATKQIVYFGELGGTDEYELAELIAQGKVTKNVYAYIAGTVASLFDEPPQFGHAKAMAHTEEETASAKQDRLRSVGVTVMQSIGEIQELLHEGANDTGETKSFTRSIGPRQKHIIVSRISGDVDGEVQLLGNDLLATVNNSSLSQLVMSMLLGQTIHSSKLIDFTDFVLRILIDHGPYVAGAANTINTARAGRDLVSSLASGILTIGPRFGGAINGAANCWLKSVTQGQSARQLVDAYSAEGVLIPGIGHKKYRTDLPDPRVTSILDFIDDIDDTKYLKLALAVQDITTNKKANLILNIDGVIAAVLLDLLQKELDYDAQKLQELVDIEFFNALFVVSRSIGFSAHYLDQRRNDEGLLRLTDKEVLYLPEDN